MDSPSIQPTLDVLKQYKASSSDNQSIVVVPLHHTFQLDHETPITVYSKLYAKQTYLFELASEKDPTKVALSIIGVHPFHHFTTGHSIRGGTIYLLTSAIPIITHSLVHRSVDSFTTGASEVHSTLPVSPQPFLA